MSEIAKALAQKTIAITGTTGFLGTALVERLLRSVPDCRLVLLTRPGKRGTKRRIETEILNNDAFNPLREELGVEKFKAMVEERITPVAADITKEGLGLGSLNSDSGDGDDDNNNGIHHLADVDIFIHSAAAVSFTSPFDLAIETNLMGPIRILETLEKLERKPHLIAVSTAYVAGNRKGKVTETQLTQSAYALDIDITAEMGSARRARASVEDESRTKRMLDRFNKEAEDHLGSPGTAALSRRREQLRQSWVKDALVEMGRERAASLGFADIYGLTKAMAEMAMCQRQRDVPLTIVRPSIIESALAEPFPGWIRGFRMAEPIIISYARGLLKDFPAKPEGVLDVIPVDMVTAALCAIAANPAPLPPNATDVEESSADDSADPETQAKNRHVGPRIYNVAAGSVNPFKFADLHDWCHNWFTQNPIYDEHDKPISPHKWSYPSRTRVNKQLTRAKRALALGESIIRQLPIRGRHAESAAILEERRTQIERALGYVQLYGMYLECEAIFDIENLLELYDSLSSEDRELFAFDPRVVEWYDYVTRIHLPSVLVQGRLKTKPNRRSTQGSGASPDDQMQNAETSGQEDGSRENARHNRLRRSILSPDRQLAAFDLENTLMASNVVASWSWLATKNLSTTERAKFIFRTLWEAPKLLAMERTERGDFLQYFYRRFEGARSDGLRQDSQEMFNNLLLARCFPAAIRRVREHRALGHRTILITGALDFVVEPLHPLFDDIICAELNERHGHYEGTLKEITPIGELRADILRDYTEEHDIDIQNAIAYADSVSDIPLLEAVGYPVAVNPEVKLAGIARRRGWLVENFTKSDGYNYKTLPIGPAMRN